MPDQDQDEAATSDEFAPIRALIDQQLALRDRARERALSPDEAAEERRLAAEIAARYEQSRLGRSMRAAAAVADARQAARLLALKDGLAADDPMARLIDQAAAIFTRPR